MALCDHSAWQDRARELQIARRALAEDDAPHAAHHAAGALALDPNDVESLQLVDALIRWRPQPGLFGSLTRMLRPEAPERRAPAFAESDWWGYHLVQARAAELDGELAQAFDTLVQVAAVAVHHRFAPWWDRLLDAAEARGVRVDVRPYLSAFRLGQSTIGLLHLRPAEQAFFAPWGALGLRLRAHAGPEHAPVLALVTAGFLRRAGRFAEAAEQARAQLPGAPDDHTRENVRVQLGLALRGLGQWEEAAATFAVDQDADPKHRSEIARTWVDSGDPERAIEALRAAPADDEIAVQLGLLLHARGEPVDERITMTAGLLAGRRPSCDDVRRLFLAHTWPHAVYPTDASTNVLGHHDVGSLAGAKMTVDAAEGPSVRMTMGLAVCGRPDPRALEYVAPVFPPDPAEPLDPSVGARLWRRDPDGVVVQAVPPPRPETAEIVRALADQVLATDRWMEAARARAAPLDADELLRALVHPDPSPGERGALPNAVFRWQVAACLLLGALDPDTAWLQSQRRTQLRAVLFSHPDWTTAAALLALLEVALDEPDAADELRTWLPWLVRQAPAKGHCPWATAVQQVYRVLPGLPPDLLKPLEGWLTEGEG